MMKKISISIADDHTLFRTALSGLLNDFDEFEVKLEADNGQDLLTKLNDVTLTDVVLVDIEMPIMDGPQTVKALREKFKSKVKILGLSMHKEFRMVNEMLESGANGFLSKDAEMEELFEAINSVYKNDFYLNANMSKMIFGKHYKTFETAETLNEIEEKIITLVCEQKTNAEIADLLNLSINTINSYRTRILDKINASNTAGLVIYAIKNNLYRI
jgi:DNA-binding NarL/FixJ family response regulator